MRLTEANWWKGFSRLLVVESRGTEWAALLIQKKRGGIEVKEALTFASDADRNAFLEANKTLPLVLALRGDFVFERIVPPTAQGQLVSAILGVNVDQAREFPVQTFPAENGNVLAAVVRKSKVDECLAALGAHAGRVTDLVFSEAVLGLPLQLQAGNERDAFLLRTANRSYALKGPLFAEPTGFAGVEKDEAEVARLLNVEAAFAFAACAGLFALLKPAAEVIPHAEVAAARREHGVVSLMKNIAATAAILLVVTSLSLFALRTWAESSKAGLQRWVQQNQTLADSVQKAKARFEARQTLREQLGGKTLKPSRASFFSDRIAALAQGEVHFQSLVLGPETDELKKAGLKEARTGDFDLLLSGWSPTPGQVTVFTVALEGQPWVKELKIVRSDLNYRTGAYDFIFLIRVNHAG